MLTKPKHGISVSPTKQSSFFRFRILLICLTLQVENLSLFSRTSSVACGNIRYRPFPPEEPRLPQFEPSSCWNTNKMTDPVYCLINFSLISSRQKQQAKTNHLTEAGTMQLHIFTTDGEIKSLCCWPQNCRKVRKNACSCVWWELNHLFGYQKFEAYSEHLAVTFKYDFSEQKTEGNVMFLMKNNKDRTEDSCFFGKVSSSLVHQT